MTCAACQANVTRCVRKLEGVDDVDVSLLANQMTVSYDETKLDSSDIIHAVQGIGYGAESQEATEDKGKSGFRSQWEKRQEDARKEQNSMKIRLQFSILFLIPLMYVAMGSMIGLPVPAVFTGMENTLVSALTQLILTVPILVLNRKFYKTGLKALVKRAPNMDSLVAIGSGASLVYGLFAMYKLAYGFGHQNLSVIHAYGHALYFESSAMILTLVTVGKYLEARSKSKTSDALGKLVDLAPRTAVVIRDGREVTIPSEQVKAGDILVIRPGESIPVDGTVTEGYGYVDQAAITGESIPVEKKRGDTVISATINRNGTFRFRASKVGEDTTLSQIIRLVDEAGNSKAPIARLADKVSGIFVPAVILIAVLTAFMWILAGENFEFALSNAIAVLVISCPCALGLATPVAIMVGTGKAAEYGILVKSAQSLEQLHSIDTVILDKTGTITTGHPSVTDCEILSEEWKDEQQFLAWAAAVETGSEHPLAQAVVEKARDWNLELPEVSQFQMEAGRGVTARIDGQLCLAGNLAFMQEQKVIDEEEQIAAEAKMRMYAEQGKTPLLFVRNSRIQGIVAVADTVRSTSRQAIDSLKKMGIRVVMLTGDNRVTAEAIRQELGITDAVSDVLPTEKEACVRSYQEQGCRVAMVGDGINDAPALTRADVGIAIGAGTDIAIESADIVLMKDSLLDVVTAIELSRSVIRNIHMNLFWAFFYNILGIPVAAGAFFPAFGLRLSPMIGSAAMSLSSVCVVTNALRLRFFKPGIRTLEEAEEEQNKEKQNNEEQEEKGRDKMKKILTVEGMMCEHCKMHVEKALSQVEGVTGAQVDLDAHTAAVTLDQDVADQTLMDAVKEAGYEPVSCRTE